MGEKVLAVINGDDGEKYRVKKWNDRHSTLMAEYGRPGRLEQLDTDDGGWNHLDWWSVAADFGNKDDGEVMRTALKRLEINYGVTPEEIIYDRCSTYKEVQPEGVEITRLSDETASI